MSSFVIGQEYERSQLLEFVGSRQTQTGVIWGDRESGCLIVTSGGRHGKKVGYSDECLKDGSWWYFGQGQTGDHRITNAANAKLLDGQKTVLLFKTREPVAAEVKRRGSYKKLFSFQGAFNVLSFDVVVPESGPRKGDKLLRFQLVPTATTGYTPMESNNAGPTKLSDLRKEVISQLGSGNALKGLTVIEYRRRSEKVRRYALLRARGKCEACGNPPPFVDEHGDGFLEVHHICRLADDGIDAPENVAAICPNCHRRAHYSADRETFRQHLLSSVLRIERWVDEAES